MRPQTDFETYPRLYTAGAMRWKDSEDSYWRRSIEKDLPHAVFYHPEEGWFDHGGDLVEGAVSEDISAIQAADGLIAYFDETPQIGTVTEVLHAAHTETPVLVLFEAGEVVDNQMFTDLPADLGGVTMRATSRDFWFLINYLSGETAGGGQRTFPDWLTDWEGQPTAVTKAVRPGDVGDVTAEWVEDTFGVDPTEPREAHR
jgi:hypothetical protein